MINVVISGIEIACLAYLLVWSITFIIILAGNFLVQKENRLPLKIMVWACNRWPVTFPQIIQAYILRGKIKARSRG